MIACWSHRMRQSGLDGLQFFSSTHCILGRGVRLYFHHVKKYRGFIRPQPRRREQVNKTFPTIRPIPFGTLRQNERMRERTVSIDVPVFLTLYPHPIGSDARPMMIRCPHTAHMDAPQNTGPHIDIQDAEQFAVRLFESDRLPPVMTRDLRIQTGNRI